RSLDEPTRRLYGALELGEETARFAPARRRSLPELAPFQVAADHIDHGVRNTRVLARTVLRHLRTGQPPLAGLPAALRELAQAARMLREELATHTGGRQVRVHALSAVEWTGRALAEHGEITTSAIASQVQAIASDLMQATGMPTDERRDALDAALAAH